MKKRNVIKMRIKSGGSPYWNYIKKNHCGEPVEANPDSIPVSEPVPSDELQAVLDVLDEGGEQVLSPREKDAFQLVAREGRTYGEAATIMSTTYGKRISRAALQMYVKRASVKIRKLCASKL
jgi:DNA-directed RNA polymerase specialized sigma24 family protein